ncbi:MAG: Holliday junction branch migration protein RuvA [Lachnospiraceae bacterium]|nr:Holliday junction branch migration protein RuvA [Lachnospiraceae bacterium]
MIGFLRGIVAGIKENTLLLDVSGVGFEINVGSSPFISGISMGDEVTVHTYMSVREDDISLYGFATADELSLFKLLITVSGIGPKGAVQIISAMGADDLRFAILTGDAKSIARAPGIGQKTAQKAILELKDKIGDGSSKETGENVSAGTGQSGPLDERSEAAEALIALGYSRTESYRAVKEAEALLKDESADANKLLKNALKFLG